ncbi:hypothetical protein OB955_11265 [Halobacteria archaeon AArc-m2/3/4]|uniref:DUF8106 domain-containing protein n=1 Tax=Natronoglomus mannanivorans TaxID=2979990 RepID=A0AAP2YXY1_9EURY|nr:hypothetical protein [Halobacteria archaeon AArc-xg1-1]MCU4973320.1 hypothetical protein [Halobacteria archaeon AArc-m2/3/4]
MSPPHSPTDGRKMVLYCQECGHDSPITGDWDESRHGDEVQFRCPDCGHLVTRRPCKEPKPVPL